MALLWVFFVFAIETQKHMPRPYPAYGLTEGGHIFYQTANTVLCIFPSRLFHSARASKQKDPSSVWASKYLLKHAL